MNPAQKRWTRTSHVMRHSRRQGGNIALVPASELSSLAKWQAHARPLPFGAILLVVPRNNIQLQIVSRRIDRSLTERGRTLTIVTNSQ